MNPLLQQALSAGHAGNKAAAYQLLLSLVRREQGDADAWFALGALLSELNKLHSSVACFSRAAALRPLHLETMVSLGWDLHRIGRDGEALPLLQSAVAHFPDAALARTDLAAVLLGEERFEEALAHALRAVEVAPDEPIHHMMLAFAYFHLEHWTEGFASYEWRFRYRMPEVLSYPMPMWRGEQVNSLLLMSEQGLGDSIQSARWIDLVRERAPNARIHISIHHQLYSLFKDRFPWAEIEPAPVTSPAALPSVDAWCPLMSLPVALSINPIAAPAATFARRPHPLGGALRPPNGRRRIGICWAGNSAHDSAHLRDVGLLPFMQLAELPSLELRSLQVGPRAADLTDMGASALIADMSPYISDMRATAEQLTNLDLVLTCDTSVAHLAGAMGIPVWLLLNRLASDWRWGEFNGNQTPWYPSMRVWRKQPTESWSAVVWRCAEELINAP